MALSVISCQEKCGKISHYGYKFICCYQVVSDRDGIQTQALWLHSVHFLPLDMQPLREENDRKDQKQLCNIMFYGVV